jgi:hypothetical protein
LFARRLRRYGEAGRICELDTYNEPEVQVIRPQLLQRRLQISSDVCRSVRVVPELEMKPQKTSYRQNGSLTWKYKERLQFAYLGNEEDVFPLHTRVLDPLTDFILVPVDQGGVDVSKRF